MTQRIYNTLSHQIEPLVPLQDGHVRMYVCGMTVYDLCHMGHARVLVAFDVVQRWLRASGLRVTYVRNITDIDDKIIRRAAENGETLRALTDRMISEMHRDADALGVQRPDHEPRATDYVPQMLDIVRRLEERGLAYQAPQGDVNFAVRAFPGYGRLSGKSLDDLQAGERVAVQDDKRDPLDFVLWKAAKPQEPDEAQWDSPYGAGRPGWHIECSAMSCALLGEHFDIHGGGQDLQFPHHENEIAQSVGASGQPFANVWMHNGFVNINDEKMSKSLGNFFTIREVLKTFDGETLRFFMLRTHYRSPINFSDADLREAQTALRRIYTALQQAQDAGVALPEPDSALAAADWQGDDADAARFAAAMSDDFNTSIALAVLFDLTAQLNRALQGPATDLQAATRAVRLLRALGATLGILQQSPQSVLQGEASAGEPDTAAIEDAIARRQAAKQARDFAAADAIRAELQAQGILLKDSPTGTTWTRA
ncbi:cysteine--tRNA ligase [Amphibiibacter pelophylacis]|uniref:Cysteine--tRNA ligase n=1 Tax=Amphibiibacter pelophylacis TaxID=1799477 RepID=A0ACC6NYY9_9BURK